MSVFVRTSRRSGISVPWIVAPFLLMFVVTYWALWLTVMFFVWGTKFSVLALRWFYAFCSNLRSSRDSERPGG